jgi:hypothetical protein
MPIDWRNYVRSFEISCSSEESQDLDDVPSSDLER